MAKVLIIDDDPYVRRFYEKLFRFSHYEVEMASGGKEGLEKAKNWQPDLVLLDIMMPDLNGLDVLKKLKGDTLTENLTVVMLTNLGDADVSRQAIGLGAGGVIVKSQVDPEMLISHVDKYIERESAKPA